MRIFPIGGTNAVLEDVSAELLVLWRGLRFNEATEQWNVDMVLTNASVRRFALPMVVSFESVVNTTGPTPIDGTAGAPPRPFLVQGQAFYSGPFLSGQASSPRTLALGWVAGAGAPHVDAKVFAQPLDTLPGGFALGLTRSLNSVGQPLPGVQVTETGPVGQRTLVTDTTCGVVTLGQGPGAYTWRFDRTNCLPVWRRATLVSGSVQVVPNPRLVGRSTNSVTITPIGGLVRDASGQVQIQVPPGALTQPANLTLTVVDGQTLPALLPWGWSPLRAFWLEFSGVLSKPASALVLPASPVEATDAAVLVRWNEANAQWEVTQSVPGNGPNAVALPLSSAGAYAWVVGDRGALAPVTPPVGQALPRSSASPPDAASLTAEGVVNPSSSLASREPEQVTGTAVLTIRTTNAPLPSGLLLHCEVRESYQLQDGSQRFTPRYENFIVGYQRPGDAEDRTLNASFPMRPLLLLGSEELSEARVQVDVLVPTAFSGGVFEPAGNAMETDGLRLVAHSGDFSSQQAALIRRLAVTNFASLVSGSAFSIAAALDLTVAGVGPGRNLSLQISNLPPSQLYVLARILSDAGLTVVEPIERLQSDTNGVLSTLEPGIGARLPGLAQAGQYLLLAAPGTQGLVRGITRDTNGQPAAGLPVRVTGEPWLTLSRVDGAYQLLAPTGAVQVSVTDLASGNADFEDVVVTDPAQPTLANLTTTPRGPRVISVSPADGAQRVSRVAPVVVTFSEPVNPATLLGGGLQLLGTNGQAVVGSLSLNLRNTTATLLPTDPLAAGTSFNIVLSTNIAGLTRLKLEGPRLFSFATVPPPTRDPAAQLIIFQPGSTNVPADILSQIPAYAPARDRDGIVVRGTPGVAEPEVPVVIANESSGETATVLSKPDGSFVSFVRGGEEDFVSATFVNQNNTRAYVPVSRQLFDNGFVGLYQRGGILEAESDGGPVQIVLAPDAVKARTQFRIKALSLTELLTVLQGVQPEAGNILGQGLQIEIQGDRVAGDADVAIPVSVDELRLPAGVPPEAAAVALAVAREAEGSRVFEVVDKLKYAEGKLVRSSFDGWARWADNVRTLLPGDTVFSFILVPLVLGHTPVSVIGKVVQAPQLPAGQSVIGDFLANPLLASGLGKPLSGALVCLQLPGATARPGRIRPGMVYTTSDQSGDYALVAPSGTTGTFFGGFELMASHPRFSDRPVEPLSVQLDFSLGGSMRKDILFRTPLSFQSPPSINVAHSPVLPAPGQPCSVQVNASQGAATAPDITVTVKDVIPLAQGVEATTSDVTISNVQQTVIQGNRKRWSGTVLTDKAIRVRLQIEASGGGQGNSGGSGTNLYSIDFRSDLLPPAGSDIPPSDPNDQVGPMVIASFPGDGDYLGPVASVRLLFNEPIDKAIEEHPDRLNLSGPGSAAVSSAVLSPDQRTLILTLGGLVADSEYTLTLSSGAIEDLSGNALDQKPSTASADGFSMDFRTIPVKAYDLPGLESGSGVAIHGSRLFALQHGSQHKMVILDIADPSHPIKLGEVTLPGTPRDLAVIPHYSYRLKDGGPIITSDLVAITGGDLGSQSIDAEGNVFFAGQYLRVYDVGDPANPQRLASPVITLRPTAVGRVVWDPPHLVYKEFGSDIQQIGFINLQEFLVGFNATLAEARAFPLFGIVGKDNNGDGDFVDDGDQFPLPEREPPEFYGKKFGYAINETPQRLLDFAVAGGTLGVTLAKGQKIVNGQPQGVVFPPAYRTVAASGFAVNRDQATVRFGLDANPKRVTLYDALPIEVDGELTTLTVALVSLSPDADGAQKLAVLDVTLPESPRELRRITIPDELAGGFLQSIQLNDQGLLELATTRHLVLLDPIHLAAPDPPSGALHRAIVGYVTGAGSGNQSVGTGPAGLHAINLGSRQQVIQSPPRMSFVSFPALSDVLNPASPPNTEADLDALWQELSSTLTVIPGRLRPQFGVQSDLDPALPQAHYHVLVEAPGGAGESIELGLESLNRAGQPMANLGLNFPPVRAAASGTVTALGQEPRPDCDAPIRPLTAYRLSSDPRSPFFNRYLSKPFALTYERIFANDLTGLRSSPDRELIWSGRFVRAFIDPSMAGNAVVGPFAAEVVGDRKRIRPKAVAVVSALESPYLMGANPPPAGGYVTMPGTFGNLAAHSGEFRHQTVDLALPSPRMPIEIERTIGGRDLYDGPFGRGWDFNYNQRVVDLERQIFPEGREMPLVIRATEQESTVGKSRDVLFHTGAGRVILFRHKGTQAPSEFSRDPLVQELGWSGTASDFYLPERGVFDLLVKFKDGRYERLEPDGTRYQYAPNGRLETVVDRYPENRHQLDYDKRGWLVRITDESVTADRFLEIGYYRFAGDGDFSGQLDESTDNAFLEGKIRRLKDYAEREVLFSYNDEGVLQKREGPELAGDNGGFSGHPTVRYVWNGCDVQGVIPGQDSTPLFAASLTENSQGETVAGGSGNTIAGSVSLTIDPDNDAASNQGQSSSATLSDGTTAAFTFDKMGYPTKFETSGGPRGGAAAVEQQFNDDGLPTFIKYPEGNSETRVYDESNPVFRSRGNLLSVSHDPGPRGGSSLTESWSYDSRYNLHSGACNDLNGNSITYTLSGDGRDVESVDYAGAGTLSMTYNDHGQVESEARPTGTTLTFGYDTGTGFLRDQTLGGNSAQFSRDGSTAGKLGAPTTITPPRGTGYSRKYDALLNLVENTRGALVEKFAYDEFGNVTLHSRTVGEGKTLTFRRTYLKKMFMNTLTVSGVEVDGSPTTLNYVCTPDDQLRVKSIQHPAGLQSFEYDNRGFMTKMTLGAYTEEHIRDLHGNTVELKQGGTTVETTKHDGHDRPMEIKQKTDAGEDVETRTYHGGGALKSVTVTDAAFGVVLDREVPSVDGLGRPETENIKGSAISYSDTYTYAGNNGGSVSIAGPRQTIKRSWDAAGYPTEFKDGNTTATITPNRNGFIEDISRAEDGASFSRSFGYDDLDNLTSLDDSLGPLFAYTPRADGRPVEVRNARANTIQQSFTVFGDLARRHRTDGMEFLFHYNERRQPRFAGDGGQLGLSFGYDGTFRQTQLTLRNGGTFTYTSFDGRNRPKSVSMPGGNMALGYDLQGRLTSQSVSYSGGTFDLTFKYDARDRLREATYGGSSATYVYDAAGPMVSATFSETGGNFPVGYALYPDGQRKSVTYPSGLTVQEDRDGAGKVLRIAAANTPIYDVVAWHGNNSPKTVSIGGGVLMLANEYDSRPRLLSSSYVRPADGAVGGDLRYLYDAADNVTARQFVHRGGRADFFSYDNGERVATAHVGSRPFTAGVAARTEGSYTPTEGGFGPGYYGRDYGYDGSGLDFLVSATLTKPGSVPLWPFASSWGGHDGFLHATSVDGLNRGAPDPLGNVATTLLHVRPFGGSGPVPTNAALRYNGLSMLTRVERADGVVIENEYQPSGLRHFRKVSQAAGSAVETAFVYDHGRLIEEYQDQQLVGRYYYAHDDAPVAADLRHPFTGQLLRYYYLRDNTLSIVGVADQTGQVVERVIYDTYGQPLIEAADHTQPTIARVVAGPAGSWLVVLSESVLVPLGSVGAGPGLVTVAGNLANSILVTNPATALPINGTAELEEASGFGFSRVLRFTPSQLVTGAVSLTLVAASVADEWGNANAAVTVAFTPAGLPGTVLFEAGGVGDTGPQRLARSAVGNPFLFQGQYFDYDTGLVYMRARFYDPYTGQYLQQDPLGYEDSVNLYAGLGNSPASFRDPAGTAKIRITSRGNRVRPIPSPVPPGGRRVRPDPSHGSGPVFAHPKPERTPYPKTPREEISREMVDREMQRLELQEAGPYALPRKLHAQNRDLFESIRTAKSADELADIAERHNVRFMTPDQAFERFRHRLPVRPGESVPEKPGQVFGAERVVRAVEDEGFSIANDDVLNLARAGNARALEQLRRGIGHSIGARMLMDVRGSYDALKDLPIRGITPGLHAISSETHYLDALIAGERVHWFRIKE
jgi:RHS repeat-associated protein